MAGVQLRCNILLRLCIASQHRTFEPGVVTPHYCCKRTANVEGFFHWKRTMYTSIKVATIEAMSSVSATLPCALVRDLRGARLTTDNFRMARVMEPRG